MSNQVSGLISNAGMISDEVRETFGKLSPEQLNWKINDSEWSIGQCFDHLIVSNNLYFKNIQKVADGTHVNNWFSAIPLFTNIVGQQLKKAVSPDSPKKIKTFPVFEPGFSKIEATVIEDFCENQETLISLMEATKDLNLRGIKIPTPISEAVNIRLSDAFEVLIMHERRHFDQAKRVLDATGFPKEGQN
jgi:hypothetical protein